MVVQAQTLWFEILKAQIETGTPYMLFKVPCTSASLDTSSIHFSFTRFSTFCLFQDTCNRKSNHQHLGTIKSSNLCAEIIQYSSPTETAVCSLASIALPQCVREKVGILLYASCIVLR